MRRMFSVGTERILDDAVTTAKILDGAVTPAKLAEILKREVIPMAVFGTWTIDGDGDGDKDDCGLVGFSPDDLWFSTMTFANAQVYDKGTDTYAWLSESDDLDGWTNPYQLTADVANVEAGDFCAFGDTEHAPFAIVGFDVGAALGTYGDDSGKWQYSKGAGVWADLTQLWDNTDSTAHDGARPFQAPGGLNMQPPGDWALDTLNDTSNYWIRWLVTAANVTQTPIMLGRHAIYYPRSVCAFKAPWPGNINEIRVVDGAAILHTGNSIKFFLMNFTTGNPTSVFSFLEDRRNGNFAVAGAGLAMTTDDILGIVLLQEDGTNEVTNAAVELRAYRGS